MTRLWIVGAFSLVVLTLAPSVAAVSADALPRIVDIRLDDENRAVITWTKGTQTSTNVKWTTVDGTMSYSDGTYGSPLADCQGGLRYNTAGDSEWLYGVNCRGDDVADSAVKHVTREEMEVGLYYFQVATCGDTIHATGAIVSCARHFSPVFEFTVGPSPEEEAEALGKAKVTGTVWMPKEVGLPSEPVRGTFTIRDDVPVHARTEPAKLTFPDGSAVVLDSRATVRFRRNGTLNEAGRVWYSLKGNPRVFFKRIDILSVGHVLRPRGATFTISNSGPKVRVYGGAVTVAGRESGRVRVPAGFELRLWFGKAPGKPRPRTAETPFWK